MIVIYCYLDKGKYKVLKLHVNKSADFGEEQHPSIKANTVIALNVFMFAEADLRFLYIYDGHCLNGTESRDLLSKWTPSQMLQRS